MTIEPFSFVIMLSRDPPLKLFTTAGSVNLSMCSESSRIIRIYVQKSWAEAGDLACEKYKDSDDSIKSNYSAMVKRMNGFLESSKIKNVARQSWLACREFVDFFIERPTVKETT